MANWTPRGFVGEQHRVLAKHVPVPPAMPSPLDWGDEAKVRERFGDGVKDVRMTPAMASLKFPFSPAETVEFFQMHFGPAQRAFAGLSAAGQVALRDAMEGTYARCNRATDGTTHVEAEYLDVVGTRA